MIVSNYVCITIRTGSELCVFSLLRKSDTPAIPVDEWEMFMASQMKPQTKGAATSKLLTFYGYL